LLGGCALLPKADPDRPAYQAGRYAAFFYTLTKPALPEKVRLAVEEGYSVLKIATADGVLPVDASVRAQIDLFYADASPAFRDMVFNFYLVAVQRLRMEVEGYPATPQPALVRNFMQGVADSLKDWSTLDAPPAPADAPIEVPGQ
jgi:hypothetical protein